VEGHAVKLQFLNPRRIVASSATLAVALGAAAGLVTPANAASTIGCDVGSCTATFAYSGATETFTVPPGVTALTIAMSGAQGGKITFANLPGAKGASVGGVLPVTPGQQLTVLVGQAGVGGGGATFGGGGATLPTSYLGSGGGGSFVFDAAGQPLLVAGGGGGATVLSQPPAGIGVGAGPGGTGASGAGLGYSGETPPTGGSPTAGGTHGTDIFAAGTDGSGPAAAGAPGQGGAGGSLGDNDPGAGGGGGYYGGGGGGYAQSGAGGSGYADPSVTSLSSTAGANAGNGVVSLSWARQVATVALTQSPSAGSTVGDPVTVSATVSGPSGTPTGVVSFAANGSAIAGCTAQALVGGTATCTTTTLAVGSVTLRATYAGDTVYAAGSSSPTSYPVAYPALTVTTATLPSGQVDDPYSVALHAAGGLAPYSWTVSSGVLPPGLTLSSSGTISGTPSVADSGTAFTVQATDDQGTAYTATAALTIGVGVGSQAIDFTSTVPAPATVGDNYPVAATGGRSGLDVTFTVDGSTTGSACSITGSTVSFDHAGPCVVDADQAGTADYSAAPTAQQLIAVGSAAQVITYTSAVPSTAVAGTQVHVTTSGGGSGLPVSLSVAASTTGSACSISGSTVSFDHAGTCVVDADQAGNDDYVAAVTAQQSITVTTVSSGVTVTMTQAPSAFGEPVHANATVTGGAQDGTVQFAVDGTDLGSPVTVVGGSAQSPALTDADGGSLAPGAHAVTASYTPNDPTIYGTATGSTTQVVNQAATTTALAVHATTLTAIVSPVAPGAGVATGTVTFSVAGQSVGTANLVGGAATLAYTVETGMTRTVAAVYDGDDSFTGSSVSTSRSDPSITATVSSAQAKTRSGWYRTPVTVTFHCATNGAPLTGPCPAAVRFAANGAGQSTTQTITATDGGVATVTTAGLNLDQTAPSVRVTGIRNGAGYGGRAPAARCVGSDALSGLASCTLTRHTSGTLTSYTARATDQAGNTRTTHGSYRVLRIYLQGAAYSGGAFTVRTGHTYTLVVTDSAGRPTYYDAAIYPHRPTRPDMAFHAAGPHRWALGITMTGAMRSHQYWNLGVKIGRTVNTVKVRIA
jgi:hypothetical protein